MDRVQKNIYGVNQQRRRIKKMEESRDKYIDQFSTFVDF